MSFTKRVMLCALLTTALGMLASCGIARAAPGDDPMFGLSVVGNVVWNDAPEIQKPNGFELGLQAKASLHNNLSLIGGVKRAFQIEETLLYAGPRLTASDAEDENFSISLGVLFEGDASDKASFEWKPDARVGWGPWPGGDLDPVTVGLAGQYAPKSSAAKVLVAVGWNAAEFGGGGQ